MLKEKLKNQHARGPLEDVLVIDFSHWLSGPYCTNMLSDLGATVIKIEPLQGEPGRSTGNLALYHAYNHGKRSFAVNLKSPVGRELIRPLLAEADVVVENFRPGKGAELGIDYISISHFNPGVVCCSINAFGDTPGWADKPGMDPIVQGMGGVMSVTGEPGGAPMLVGVPVADNETASQAFGAIVAALYRKARTGLGQQVSVSMIDVMVFGLSTRFGQYVGTGKVPQRLGSAHSQIVPYQAFPTQDGWITVGAQTDVAWQRLCQAVGADDLAADGHFTTNALRLANRDALTESLSAVFRTRSSEDWLKLLPQYDVLCGPIWNVKQLLVSDLVKDHGCVQEVSHAKEGRYPVLLVPHRYHSTPGRVQGPSPMLGEHTREVLVAMGYEDEQIREFDSNGIVRLCEEE